MEFFVTFKVLKERRVQIEAIERENWNNDRESTRERLCEEKRESEREIVGEERLRVKEREREREGGRRERVKNKHFWENFDWAQKVHRIILVRVTLNWVQSFGAFNWVHHNNNNNNNNNNNKQTNTITPDNAYKKPNDSLKNILALKNQFFHWFFMNNNISVVILCYL